MSSLRHHFFQLATWLTHGAVPIAIVLCIAFVCPRLGSGLFRKAESLLGRIARRRALAILWVGLFALGISAGFSLLVRMPVPVFEDEFSFLLSADTFAHGRLANPPHPMWQHFETIWVLQQPTYASVYPPGLGLVLAAGQVIGGHPIVGSWLLTALACSAICWMLMAWLPPRWALLGGLLACVHPMIFSWSQSTWGGLDGVAGGALLMGGLRRITNGRLARNSLWTGLGLAILANSRPFEGMILTLLSMPILLLWMFHQGRSSFPRLLKRVLLPICAVLVITVTWIGYYNFRVTGNALAMPQLCYGKEYCVVPTFVWQGLTRTPSYRHKDMQEYLAVLEVEHFTRQRSLRGNLAETKNKILSLIEDSWIIPGFFPLSVLGVPLLVQLAFCAVTIPWLWRDRWMRWALLICALFTIMILQVTWMYPRYAAPSACLLFAIALQSLRHVRLWRWRARLGRVFVPSGLFIMRGIVILCIAAFAFKCKDLSRAHWWNEWAVERATIVAKLEKDPERHLIIVRYGPKHWHIMEWVYNEADIDNSKVVWARDMGESKNQELLDYYKDRRVWLLEADETPPKLAPYRGESAANDAKGRE